MSFNGVRLFRYALLTEIAMNVTSIIPCLIYPEGALSYLVKGPNQIVPATKTMVQWFATQPSQSPAQANVLQGSRDHTHRLHDPFGLVLP